MPTDYIPPSRFTITVIGSERTGVVCPICRGRRFVTHSETVTTPYAGTEKTNLLIATTMDQVWTCHLCGGHGSLYGAAAMEAKAQYARDYFATRGIRV